MTLPTADGFKRLLAWFDDDEVTAHEKLHDMRHELVLFFRKRGLTFKDIDDLVQDVVMTTASKCCGTLPPYPGPEPLMIGIARKLLLRHFRRQSASREVDLTRETFEISAADPEKSAEAECLETVLANFPPDERALLITYYGSDKRKRADLAKVLTLSSTALRVRVFRLKQQAHERLLDCLQPGSV